MIPLVPLETPIASGHLGGWKDNVPDSLIYPIKPTSVRVPFIYGDTTFDDFWVRTDSLGAIAIIQLHMPLEGEVDTTWFNHWKNSCSDSVQKMDDWAEHARSIVDYGDSIAAVYDGIREIHYDVWNEPDLPIFWRTASCWSDPVALFFDAWDVAYNAIKIQNPNAIVTGPSLGGALWGASVRWVGANGMTMEGFLEHCAEENTVPDILGWHDLGWSDPEDPNLFDESETDSTRNLYAQVLQARGLVYEILGDSSAVNFETNEILPDSVWGGQDTIGDYILPRVYLTPGTIVRECALAEKTRWDDLGLVLAARAYWTDPCAANPGWQGGRLTGLINPGHQCLEYDRYGRRYAWWVYKWYADLSGQFVRTDVSGKLDALASYTSSDPETGEPTCRILLGRFMTGNEEDLEIRIKNIPSGLIVNGAVGVTVSRMFGHPDSLFVARHGLRPAILSHLPATFLVEGDSAVIQIDSDDLGLGDALGIEIAPFTPSFTIAPGSFGDIEAAIQATDVGNYALVEEVQGGLPWVEDNIHLKNGVQVIVQPGSISTVRGDGDTVFVFPENANAFTSIEGLEVLAGEDTEIMAYLSGAGAIRSCSFDSNGEDPAIGILALTTSGAVIESTFVGGCEAGIYADEGTTVQYCTADSALDSGIYGYDGSTIENCIVSNFLGSGPENAIDADTVRYCLSADDIEANVGVGNLEEDPLLCGDGQYTLRVDSYGNPANNPSGNQIGAFPVACIGGLQTMARSTTWPGSPLNGNVLSAIDDIGIPSGVTLTLEPGSVIEFPEGGHSSGGVDVELQEIYLVGRLVVQGSSGSPITFKSSSDTAAAGDWYGIWMDDDAVALIDHALVEHAVSGIVTDTKVESLSVSNSTFDRIEIDGVYAEGDQFATIQIIDNTFVVRGGWGITSAAENLTISGNTVIDSLGTSLAGIVLSAVDTTQVITGTTSKGFATGSALYVDGSANKQPKVRGSTFKNSRYGIHVTTSDAMIGGSSSSDANTITGNSYAGIYADGSDATPIIRYNNLDSNGNAVRVENGAAPDVGNTSTTLGNNKITNSSHYCIWNRNSGGTPQVLAEGNYFGTCTGGIPPICWAGNVLTTSYLCSAPFGVQFELRSTPEGPGRIVLLRAQPNPMGGRGNIAFDVSGGSNVAKVQIFDIAGRLVRDLGRHEVGAGRQAIWWDGHTDSGTHARSGVYFVRMTVKDEDPVVSKFVVAR